MERLLDAAARELKMDPVEIRRKNLLPPNKYPYKGGIIGQDFVEGVLDSGDYLGNMDKALELIGYDNFIKKSSPNCAQPARKLASVWCAFTEGTGVGPI